MKINEEVYILLLGVVLDKIAITRSRATFQVDQDIMLSYWIELLYSITLSDLIYIYISPIFTYIKIMFACLNC